jgi:hypothetical protein
MKGAMSIWLHAALMRCTADWQQPEKTAAAAANRNDPSICA